MGISGRVKKLAFLVVLFWVGTAELRKLENFALHKNAYQSSTWSHSDYPTGSADKAVDGGLSQHYNDGSCTHTNTNISTSPYWEVDLGKKVRIQHVTIYNRGDCCAHLLADVDLYIGRSKESYIRYGHHKGAVGSIYTFRLEHAAIGQWVRIQMDHLVGTNMVLCEVQVFGYTDYAHQNYEIIENQAGIEAAISASRLTASITHCTYVCFKTNGCVAASYKKGSQRCDLLTTKSTNEAADGSVLISTY